jgi:hypothetical protein
MTEYTNDLMSDPVHVERMTGELNPCKYHQKPKKGFYSLIKTPK